jgi:hypothetical protein
MRVKVTRISPAAVRGSGLPLGPSEARFVNLRAMHRVSPPLLVAAPQARSPVGLSKSSRTVLIDLAIGLATAAV